MSGKSHEVEVEIVTTQRIRILGVDERSPDKLAWCAFTYGCNRIFWSNGYLLCLEVLEKAFEYEVEKGFFPIAQLCYAKFPNYTHIYEVSRGMQIPIVDVSDMLVYRKIVEAIQALKR